MSDLMAALDAELGQQPEEVSPAAEIPRDERGRFASPQAEAEPEQAAEPEPVEEPSEEKILGRFRSPDDLAKSYQALEAKLNEQGAELGELRKLREQFEQQQEAYQQPQVPLTQEAVDWIDEQAMQNPQGAAIWAMQNDPSGVLYNRVMDSWFEMAPRQAATFERQVELQAVTRAFEERLTSATAPLESQVHRNDFASAWAAVAQAVPDLPEHSDAILEAAQSAPEVVSLLQKGTLEDKKRVIENLYYLAKGKQATSLASAAQQMAAQQAQETQAAKEQAFVASSGQRNEPENKSNVERWFEEVFDPAAQQYY